MGIFSFESPFMSFLTKACEYMLVCLLCLLFSLPVITAGAAITSSYYVGMKLFRDEDAGFFKSFLKGFKDNFKQSTIIWLIELFVGCFLAYDWYLIYSNGIEEYNRVLIILLAIVTLYMAMVDLAIFALVARFKMSTKEAIKGAFAYTYVNVPRMVFILILTAFPTSASIRHPNWLMAIWPVGSAASLYIICYNFSKSFKKLELHVLGLDEDTDEGTDEEIDNEIDLEADIEADNYLDEKNTTCESDESENSDKIVGELDEETDI